jgi:adenylyltransferase/sulfurtransferase
MRSITALQLKEKLAKGEDIQLIDVREPFEHEAFNIGGTLIPLGEIVQQVDKISKEKEVVFYCRKGIRSQLAIQRLLDKFPYTNLTNLIGGTEMWKKEFSV